MVRKGRAVWRGTGKDGTGELTTDSGVLSSTPYSFKTRFESEPGTNPEELIAAAHAGCFTMALAFQLQGAGFTPTELATEAAVSLEKEGQGFRISKSSLTLRAQGFPPKPADLAAVQAALAKRPNQSPLIAALQATIAHQHQLQSEAGSGSAQNQPGLGVSVNQGNWAPGNPMIQDSPIFPMPGRS